MNSNSQNQFYTPIEHIRSNFDPWSKQHRGESYFVFSLLPLELITVDGLLVAEAPTVRLPINAEPGRIYELCATPSPQPGFMLVDHDERSPSLLEPCLVLITDDLMVKLL